ncbi:MAG: MerR family transcriptional regulator [Parachlamydiaceae bacterium]
MDNETHLDNLEIPSKLPRSLPEITMFRGDQFMINLIKIHESPKCQKTIEGFRSRTLSLKKDDATYRVLSHWDNLDLLECERDGEKGWRRFNLIERLWVQVIIRLRKIGLSLEQIKLSKPFFFEQISSKCWISYVEYYCLSALILGRPVKLLVLEDGQAEFLDYAELNGIEEWTSLRHFISLSVNQMLSTVLNKPLKINHPLEREVSLHQYQICDLIDSEDFDFMKIVKNENTMTGFEYQKTFSGKIPEKELTDGYSNYEIRKKVVDDHVTSQTRTIRKSTKEKK